METIRLNLGERTYDINVGRGLLSEAGKYFNLNRRTLVLTDDGVPAEYASTIARCCAEAKIVTVRSGEGAKSLEIFGEVLSTMADFGMTRTDCCVAVGGGVIGDLCGFCAASYMRGIDFYNVPTTVLSQVDSSIGGKVAINFSGVKNLVGAFYQPKGVIIDPDVLKTLPARQISNGLCEAVKMAATSDEELFHIFENQKITLENIDKVIVRALKIKKFVVENDERESGLRKILNFGHTFGHGVEASSADGELYHGESVAVGMTVACSEAVKARLVPVLRSLNLPVCYDGDLEAALDLISHDKKCDGAAVSVVFVEKIGEAKILKLPVAEFCDRVRAEINRV